MTQIQQIAVIDETKILTFAQITTLCVAAQQNGNKVALYWGKPMIEVFPADQKIKGAWNVHLRHSIVDINAHALGIHNVDPDGSPQAFVSVDRTHRMGFPFGYIMPGLLARSAKKVWRVVQTKLVQVILPATKGTPEKYIRGSLSEVLTHEIGEMIADPFVGTYITDPITGLAWLVETADLAHAFCYVETVVEGTKITRVVVADQVTPEFFSHTPKGNLSLTGKITQPFFVVPGSYGFRKDASGHLIPADLAPDKS
jgi:hypothetical protein